VHIGVSDKADCINLETCAYNNMNFRVADESGFCPSNEVIDTDLSLDQAMQTDLDVNKIAALLQEDNLPFIVSTDPGRFICNYIYYRSMQKCGRSGYPKKSIFVHIPPFDKIDRNSQMEAICALIRKLYETCF
jgi:pyroglutamyl-peptidase